MKGDEETIILRLIQLRASKPRMYAKVPKEWRQAVVNYEAEKKRC